MRLVISIVVSVLPLFLVFACAPVEVSPEEATFANVTAIIEEFCLECHSGDKPGGELSMESYEALLKGGEEGSAIEPGDAENSLLIMLVERREKPYMPMKPKGGGRAKRVPSRDIAILRMWIDAGAQK